MTRGGGSVRELVLVRHGESEADRDDWFAGWLDPPLTPCGQAQARAAGRRLDACGVRIGEAFAAPSSRAVASCALILKSLGSPHLRIRRCAGLIGRDYGVLDGIDEATAERLWGRDRILRWRRSYDGAPPGGESHRDTAARVLPAYLREILPAAMGGTALVVAHGASLRALVMALERVDPDDMAEHETPRAAIRRYRLGADTSVVSSMLIEAAPDHADERW